jgi:formylglycine-generating enzyme required for sulfatase activity
VRAQLLVGVVTTAPVVGELADHPEYSSDLAMDTLRVDVIEVDGSVSEVREFVAPEALDWPLSFGVTGAPDVTSVRLRFRLFRASRADTETVARTTASKPWPETTIDRLVDVALPSSGISDVHVVLDAECLGTPVNLFIPATTCVMGDTLEADPSTGVLAGAATRIDVSELALEEPCRGAVRDGRICVAGGFSVLGDATLAGVVNSEFGSTVPLRPVRLKPYWLDQTEFTVGRFRQLSNSGAYSGDPPDLPDPSDVSKQNCSWLGNDDPSHDALPLNCVSRAAAEAACAASGGTLPTEARYEHAARGRGQARAYPWGSVPPTCCTASLGRQAPIVRGVCAGAGPEAVGSHVDTASCAGIADVSRDGVVDLGGSVSEFVLDSFAPYDSPCWTSQGVPVDPECQDPTTKLHSMRGGNWSSGLDASLSALRTWDAPGSTAGFRCAYEDAE